MFIVRLQHTRGGSRGPAYAWGIVMGVLLSLSLVVGWVVVRTDGVEWLWQPAWHVVVALAATGAGSFVLSWVFRLLFERVVRLDVTPQDDKGLGAQLRAVVVRYPVRSYLLLCSVVLLSWVPCLLAFWPGIFSYDLPMQTAEALSGRLTGHHPPFHTLLWGVCLALDGDLGGLRATTIYALMQMVVLASALAAVPWTLARHGGRAWVCVLALLLPVLNPVIHLFSINPTKDVLFAAALVMLLLRLYVLAVEGVRVLGRRSFWAGYCAIALACCLLRNNAVYALALAVPVSACMVGRTGWRRMLVLSLLSVALGLVASGVLYGVLDVVPGSVGEALSVPLQQLARVVRDDPDSLTAEQRKVLSAFLPVDQIGDLYTPRLADPVKGSFSAQGGQLAELLGVWVSLGASHPVTYLDAFLSLNVPYWYPLSSDNKASERVYVGVVVTGQDMADGASLGNDQYGFVRQSRIPWLLARYVDVATFDAFRGNPLLSVMFGLAFPFWFMFGCLGASVAAAKRRAALPFVPALAVWLTFTVGPASLMRYLLPLVCCYPIFLGTALQPWGTRGVRPKG